jgi:hypothetical protein
MGKNIIMKPTRIHSSSHLFTSLCDLLACMLAVKKVALLIVSSSCDLSQYESDISEYKSFDMSVITRLWFSKPRTDQATLSLNPMLERSNSLLVSELRLVAPWVKCLKVISLEAVSERDANFPHILVCLLDTRASKLNKKLSDEWFFAGKLIKNIIYETIDKK